MALHTSSRWQRVIAIAALLSMPAVSAEALVTTDNPILFVAQVPVGGFGAGTSVFGNHLTSIAAMPRGGDLMIRYGDGTLKNLTHDAGYGDTNVMQGANAIAVREPCVHWDGTKALFSMVVGTATAQYQQGSWRWQIYEVSGLGKNDTPQIRKIDNQPTQYNNVSPIYATNGRILFTSDRPRGGEAHLYPQRDEYESAYIVSGIWSLDEATGDLELIEHSPSGATSLSLDSFGRVIFTKWDHLQRDQQGDAPDVVAAYQSFTYASEDADAAKTTVLAGAEVFPEPRDNQDPGYSPALSLHTFNHFFPWEINEDGTAEETLNHVGRHEFGGAYTEGSFVADDNLSYYTPDAYHANTVKIGGDGGLFHLREDPNNPGDFLATVAPEFGTASGGTLMRITGAPSINPDQMHLYKVTPTNSGATPVPSSTGYFRNPLPLTDGQIVAAHTAATGQAANTGTTQAPNWNYSFRLKKLAASGPTMAAGELLTTGITKTLKWWTPDSLASWTGTLWEIDPVEVVARTMPAPRQSVLPPIEAAVFTDEAVDVDEFRQYLRDNELALIVTRNVTQRDRADLQQPFNLSVPGGVESIGAPGTVYDVSHLQIFQGDALRGYGPINAPRPGRRLLARPMHGTGVSQDAGAPIGGVTIASDGSIAAIVPARRALTWQLTGPDGKAVVRERNWLSFQAGEIRVCTNCHGTNTQSQTGDSAPTNEPEALHLLLADWKTGGGPTDCTSGIALAKPVLKVKAAPFLAKFGATALLPVPFIAVDPTANGVRVVVAGVVDATIPGGAGWTTRGTNWSYRDNLGAIGGVTRLQIRNLSAKESGRLMIKLKASGSAKTLPAPAAVEASVTFGTDDECAAFTWNPPGTTAPKCEGNSSRLTCR